MAVEINISELRLVINRILDHIEHDLGHASVKLNQDDYWDAADAERYDFTKSPGNFEHGQLHDDWEFLSSIIKDKDQAVAFMLIHVAPLLRCIGEEVGQ
ncbi:MAG: hypothetical protein JF606_13110 [Burkholderiales bacterium]|jgi:hypothetical protein|nr:hypothetical protein [Burkholderiales bacterium]